MTRNVITKDGTRVEPEAGPNTDYNDACELLGNPAWTRYWARKVKERRDVLSKELETLESADIIEFKKRQAKIEALDEIMKIPANDVKNLSRR